MEATASQELLATQVGQYYPVSIELYDEDDLVDVDLYIRHQQKFVLYKTRNLPWTRTDRDRLVLNRIRHLFAKFTGRREYLWFMERNLEKIIHSPRIPTEEKAKLLYDTSTHHISDLLAQPHSTTHIERSIGFVNHTISYLLSAPEAFFKLLELASHNYYTYTHSVNVCTYAVSLAKKLGIRFQQDLLALGAGALLHDIGKHKVPHRILDKPGPLNEDEWTIMRKHPVFGYETVLDQVQVPLIARQIILEHHEKPDAHGYPKGLPGNIIHLYSKMISISDCFDAMTTNRSYSRAQKGFHALQYMRERRATHFDDHLLTHFILMLKKETG